jgi:excisionase family DNA binding protein
MARELGCSPPRNGGEPLLTAEQAAEHLGLPSTKALYQRVRRRQIPAHRLGKRSLRFLRSELDAAALDCRIPPR